VNSDLTDLEMETKPEDVLAKSTGFNRKSTTQGKPYE